MRYEIIGSGQGSGKELPLWMQREVLKAFGATNIREAYMYGWNNLPKTLRFTAKDDCDAKRIAQELDYANNPNRTLGGGGGLLREYGLHWKEPGQ